MYLSFTDCLNCPDSRQVSKLALATSLEVEAWFRHACCIRLVIVEYEWTDEDKTVQLDGSNFVNSTIVLLGKIPRA